mgnify:CR=1 FL=1
MEENSEEEVPAGVHVLGGGGISSGPRMRLGLLGPEQVILVPELPRAEPWREDDVPLPQKSKLRRLLGFLLLGLLRLRLLGLRGHGGGGEEGRAKSPAAPQMRKTAEEVWRRSAEGNFWRWKKKQ